MIIRYSPAFLLKLKKLNVRIRKSFIQRIEIFYSSPYSPQLNNHLLRDEYEGFRSIDITSDYRALYEELKEGKNKLPILSQLEPTKSFTRRKAKKNLKTL